MADKKSLKKTIGIIGAGRIAYSIVPAFKKAGYKVTAVSSKSTGSAKKLAAEYGVSSYSRIHSTVVDKSDIIILAVPDSEIHVLGGELSKAGKINGKTFIHLSGAVNSEVLYPLYRKGAGIGSIHIMQAFPRKKAVDIKGCFASIETGNRKTESLLKKLATDLGLNPFSVSGEDKILIHIMCVFASNFMNANFFLASLLSKKVKKKIPPVEKFLYPLAVSNLSNIHQNGAVKALSGPAVRKDYTTLIRHIDILDNLAKNDPKLERVLNRYVELTSDLLYISGGIGKKRDNKTGTLKRTKKK